MMDEPERAAYRKLPKVVRMFRGCGPRNRKGFCWSLEREVAEKFPSLSRYLQAKPMLLTGEVSRDKVIALQLSRDEAEIICDPEHVRVVDVRRL